MNTTDIGLAWYIAQLRKGNINQRACAIALEFGDIDGAHHKQWVIDQMLRIMAGSAYGTIIATFEINRGSWDCGIAP